MRRWGTGKSCNLCRATPHSVDRRLNQASHCDKKLGEMTLYPLPWHDGSWVAIGSNSRNCALSHYAKATSTFLYCAWLPSLWCFVSALSRALGCCIQTGWSLGLITLSLLGGWDQRSGSFEIRDQHLPKLLCLRIPLRVKKIFLKTWKSFWCCVTL